MRHPAFDQPTLSSIKVLIDVGENPLSLFALSPNPIRQQVQGTQREQSNVAAILANQPGGRKGRAGHPCISFVIRDDEGNGMVHDYPVIDPAQFTFNPNSSFLEFRKYFVLEFARTVHGSIPLLLMQTAWQTPTIIIAG